MGKIYKSCQNSLWCPDTFGHIATWILAGYFLVAIHVNPAIAIFAIVMFGGLWEVYEAYNDKKPVGEWFKLIDTLKDMFIDYLGGLIGIGVGVQYGFHWWFVFLVAFIGLFFGRFVSWEELKDKWWDYKLWRYFPMEGIKRILGGK